MDQGLCVPGRAVLKNNNSDCPQLGKSRSSSSLDNSYLYQALLSRQCCSVLLTIQFLSSGRATKHILFEFRDENTESRNSIHLLRTALGGESCLKRVRSRPVVMLEVPGVIKGRAGPSCQGALAAEVQVWGSDARRGMGDWQ